jgi:glycosyltransferase involved in cell wall biosynthesis
MDISVIIPVFNAESFIAQAIDSCLLQKQVKEIILIEDGSTDNSYDICKKYTSQYDKVILRTHEDHKNLGPSLSRNLGIQSATKEYITFLDADDYFLDNRFDSAIKVLENDATIDSVYSRIKNVNLSGEKTSYPDYIPEECYDEEIFLKMIKGNTSISIISMLIKRSSLINLDHFDPRLILGQDLDFAFNIAHKTKLKFDQNRDCKIIRNIHRNNRSLSSREDHISNRLKIFRKWFFKIEKEKFTKNQKKVITRNYISYILQNSSFKKLDQNIITRFIAKSTIFFYLYVKERSIMRQYF